MDTAIVCHFVEGLSFQNQNVDPQDVDVILQLIVDTSSAASQFMHIVFGGPFWILEGGAWQAISAGHAFLQRHVKWQRKVIEHRSASSS